MIGHYRRLQRIVRLGGVHLGPLRIPFTGRDYTVGPMSVLQWMAYVSALGRITELGAPLDEAGAALWLARLPLEVLRPLAAVLVSEPLRERDLRRITKRQMEALLSAAGTVNDFAFIAEEFRPRQESGKGKADWGMEDTVDALVSARPCYAHRDLLRMPVQEFLSIARTLERRGMEAEMEGKGLGKRTLPAGTRPASEEEIAAVSKRLAARGIPT